MLKLYENIKQLRIENGWSQDELAQKVGYTDRSSITKIESGKVDLTQSKIKKFAEVFGVSVSELMGPSVDNAPYYLNDETREIAQMIYENKDMKTLFDMSRKMSPDRLRAHIEFMKKLQDMENMED